MKRLAILCALACALVACDKQTMNEIEKTASFYVQTNVKNFDAPAFEALSEMLELDENGFASKGMVFLVDRKNMDKILDYEMEAHESDFGWFVLGSWKVSSYEDGLMLPVDSNYSDNPYDLFRLFQDKKVSAIRSIEHPYGEITDVPYGDYALICCIGEYHNNTLRMYRGAYCNLSVNENTADTIIGSFRVYLENTLSNDLRIIKKEDLD